MPLVDRYVAPPDDSLALGLDGRYEEALELDGAAGLAGEKANTDAVGARRGQRLYDLGAEERIGDAEQQARPVATVRVSALGTAVLEIRQRRQRAHDRFVTRDAVEAGDEGDAARVVLVRRIVEPERLAQTVAVEPGRAIARRAADSSGSRRRVATWSCLQLVATVAAEPAVAPLAAFERPTKNSSSLPLGSMPIARSAPRHSSISYCTIFITGCRV